MTDVPAPQVWPTLKAREARKLIDFLVTGFGFEEVVAYTDDAGRVAHAQLAWPEGGGIMLGDVTGEPGDWDVQPGTFGAYVVTADPAAVLETARAAGATVVKEVYTTDYGSTDCTVRDPEGNVWQFGTYRGEARRT